MISTTTQSAGATPIQPAKSHKPRKKHVPVPPPTLDLERALAGSGADLVVGFDEVGRGALAGPVMVGAAAMWAADVPTARVPEGLTDSKLLTPHRREAMVEPLHVWCAADAVGQASNREIDEWGISHALGVAALRALAEVEEQLIAQCGTGLVGDLSSDSGGDPSGDSGSRRPHALHSVAAILDGPYDYISKALGTFDAPLVPVVATVTCKVKGDQSCALVSAASVVAKVTRDALMTRLAASDTKYAGYDWESNKGYGSAAHRAAIAALGPTDLHRVSWHLT